MNSWRPQRQPLTKRTWAVISLALVMLAALIGTMLYMRVSVHPSPLTEWPVPSAKAALMPSRSAESHKAIIIRPSAAVQIYMPAPNKGSVINAPVVPMPSSCRRNIEPPLSGSDFTGVFQCMDYGSLPGTNSPSLTILAGHSSRYVKTVFDRLSTRHTALIGRKVMIRTHASGRRWLVYTVQHVYRPLKTELPYMGQIWGGGSTASRLVLVTCIEHTDWTPSTNNLVVVARYSGIEES